jgi:hypothetical protein
MLSKGIIRNAQFKGGAQDHKGQKMNFGAYD